MSISFFLKIIYSNLFQYVCVCMYTIQICLKCRVRDGERKSDLSYIFWFKPQMTSVVGAGLACNLEPKTPSWSPMWVAVTQGFGMSSITSPGMLARIRLEVEQLGLKMALVWDAGSQVAA